MPQKVKVSDALAIKATLDALNAAQTAEEIEAEFAEKKADLDAALAEHQKIRDEKMAALTALKAQADSVKTETGVDVEAAGEVDLTKLEVLTKAEVAAKG